MKTDRVFRVACLYRVSTKRQVEENDIPMQKTACRAFIDRMEGWTLAREYTEKGVSGYHKSAEQRDVLQQARRDAEQGLFDILLVFMFDRLGRREDETPFIVEWFVQQGVAVWSVTEGQQRFDNRVDKLLNYIRFWQSGGESEKTSIRVREKHRQMVEDGQFRGGGAPYGYYLIDSGMKNNKGYPLKKLCVDEAACEVVRMIFKLAAEEGYGGRRIARYLNEHDILTKRGNPWTPVSVTDLLKNPIYAGRYVSGRRRNARDGTHRIPQGEWIHARAVNPALTIVDEALWKKAEAVRAARVCGSGNYPRQTRGPLLLTGLLRCGACGTVMTSHYTVKHWVRKRDGKEMTYHRPAYRCPNSNGGCAGQKSFGQKKVDPVVLFALRFYWAGLPPIAVAEKLREQEAEILESSEAALTRVSARLKKAEGECLRLTDEISRVIEGESPFNAKQLSEIIRGKESEIQRLREALKKAEYERSTFLAKRERENPAGTPLFIDWRAVFERSPTSTQKMLLASLIQFIEVKTGLLKIYMAFPLD